MINELIKLADFLDSKGLQVEADYLDSLIKKVAEAPQVREGDVISGNIQADTTVTQSHSGGQGSQSIVSNITDKTDKYDLKRKDSYGEIILKDGSKVTTFYYEVEEKTSGIINKLLQIKITKSGAHAQIIFGDDRSWSYKINGNPATKDRFLEFYKKIINDAKDPNDSNVKGLEAVVDKLTAAAKYIDTTFKKTSHSFEGDESDCEQDLGDELYYFKNLSEMLEDTEQENEAHDLVDT